MVPFFILFTELGGFYSSVFAFITFFLASMTDFFDGRIARKNKTVTFLGIFLDPLADKLLISAAFICFVDIQPLGIPAWLVIIIIAREFLISGLRSIAAVKNVIIPADRAGKFKTTLQMIVIVSILIILIVNYSFIEFNGVKENYSALFAMMSKIPFWATAFTAIITIYSGANYIFKNKKLLVEQ
jgi:CDP-diacylglycerol--glycerol-3-phosphate 3-phosphatidyltransferase